MNRTLTSASIAHYYPRLAELSTLPTSHADSSRSASAPATSVRESDQFAKTCSPTSTDAPLAT